MKHLSYFFFFCVFHLPAGAFAAPSVTLNSPLFSLEKSEEHSGLIEVLAINSPRVLFLNSTDQESIVTARVAIATRSRVVLDIDPSTYEISKIQLSEHSGSGTERPHISRWNPGNYTPSSLKSNHLASSLFNSVDSYQDSDLSDNCYNRAHYWARTFDLNQKIKSMKVFVLFTSAYRKQNHFNWWYHVAPYVNVTTREGESRVVLDPSYENGPLDIRKWVFHFASKADHCRVAKNLFEYEDTESLGGCVVITASMYHYSPKDLDLVNPPVNWRCEDLRAVEKALRAPAPHDDWRDYPEFIPDYCR